MAERDIVVTDNYLKKLNTLLPAEVTSLFLFVKGMAAGNRNYDPAYLVMIIIMGIVFYLVSPRLLLVSNRTTRCLYVVTFFIWAASIEVLAIHSRLAWDSILFVIPAGAAIWSFALPYLFDASNTEQNS